MSERHEDRPRTRVGTRWLVAATALLALFVSLAAIGPADAAAKTVKTQLSLSGLASADNPLGGSVIGVHPGDSVTFSTSAAPTAGLDKLGLGGLVNLLGPLANVQTQADFSKLPGGAANTVLAGAATKTFRFPAAGTYAFTWEVQNVGLFNAVSQVTLPLDGNQLAQAGIKLNANDQYVGTIVVANNPPKGGLSLQLPKISIAPNLPVVGQLPTITIPGVTLPTVPVSVPDLLPGKATGGGSGSGGKTTKAPAASSAKPGFTYTPPGLTIPDLVVPQGNGGGGAYSGGGGDTSVLADSTNGLLPDSNSTNSGNSTQQVTAAGSKGLPAYNSDGTKTVDLATDVGTPSSQMPVILAILAILALALVAGTYARLFLLKKQG